MSGRGSKLHRALDRGRGRGCGGKSSKGMAIGAGAVGELGRAGALECDHVTPQYRGGDPYDLANLQTLCRACHIDKTRGERERPDPGRDAWRELLARSFC